MRVFIFYGFLFFFGVYFITNKVVFVALLSMFFDLHEDNVMKRCTCPLMYV